MRDKFLHSKQWKTLREASLFRDGHACFLCGATEKLCVHHVLYRRGNKQLQDEPLNLITLCSACHWKVHKDVGNLLLAEKLLQDRPLQYDWIMNHIKKHPSS